MNSWQREEARPCPRCLVSGGSDPGDAHCACERSSPRHSLGAQHPWLRPLLCRRQPHQEPRVAAGSPPGTAVCMEAAPAALARRPGAGFGSGTRCPAPRSASPLRLHLEGPAPKPLPEPGAITVHAWEVGASEVPLIADTIASADQVSTILQNRTRREVELSGTGNPASCPPLTLNGGWAEPPSAWLAPGPPPRPTDPRAAVGWV